MDLFVLDKFIVGLFKSLSPQDFYLTVLSAFLGINMFIGLNKKDKKVKK